MSDHNSEAHARAGENLPVLAIAIIDECDDLVTPSSQALRDSERILAKFAPSTRRNYSLHVRRFAKWAHGDGITQWDDITDRILAEFVEHLRDVVGLGHSSAALALSAIRTTARAMGCPIPEGMLTSAVLTTMRKSPDIQKRRRGQAKPIQWAQADTAAALAAAEGTVLGLRDAALFAVMSDAMLRTSEAAALNCEDIRIEDDGSGRLFVARSKTDQAGQGAWLFLGPPTVTRVRAWQEEAEIDSGPLFRQVRRGGSVQEDRLTHRGLLYIIQRRAEAAGIGGASGHSFRVGAAQSLAAAGASVVDMQNAGRWADPRMPSHYSAAERANRGAVARFRYGGASSD